MKKLYSTSELIHDELADLTILQGELQHQIKTSQIRLMAVTIKIKNLNTHLRKLAGGIY